MFAAITGILASRNQEGASEFFTSALYPYLFEETLKVNSPAVQRSFLFDQIQDQMTIAAPAILGATLVDIVKSYSNPVETLTVGSPLILSAQLQDTIVYKSYNGWPTEAITVNDPSILSMTMATTIAYATYNNWPTEFITVAPPSILSATLA